MIEGAASIAEMICRYAVVESLYPLAPPRGKAGEELARALSKLYAAILIYESKAKAFFGQSSASESPTSFNSWDTC